MNKPELVVTPRNLADLEELCTSDCAAFLIGEEQFSVRSAGDFSTADLAMAKKLAEKYNKKIYVAVNILIHADRLKAVKKYLQWLASIGVDGVLFADPAVYMLVKELELELPLHFGAETTVTNYGACNFWAKKGIKRVVVSRELPFADIKEIKAQTEIQVEAQVYGVTCMFQSKRNLIDNYTNHINNPELNKLNDISLYDKERLLNYAICQDQNGTHIMSANDICMIDELDVFIDASISSLRIEGLLQTSAHIAQVVNLYATALNLAVTDRDAYKEQKQTFFQKIASLPEQKRKLDRGFYYKKTVY